MSDQDPRKAEASSEEEPASSHWQLLRDVVGFQFKLAADGLRDILLSPVSIVAALMGIIGSPDNPHKYFNRLLKFGHRTDRWINLFGATRHYREGEVSSDTYIRKVEDAIVREYEKGGPIRIVKEQTDGVIRRIGEQKSRGSGRSNSDGNIDNNIDNKGKND